MLDSILTSGLTLPTFLICTAASLILGLLTALVFTAAVAAAPAAPSVFKNVSTITASKAPNAVQSTRFPKIRSTSAAVNYQPLAAR